MPTKKADLEEEKSSKEPDGYVKKKKAFHHTVKGFIFKINLIT